MNPGGNRAIHTAIVATLGPASADPAVLRRLVEAGTDVFRLNFSHGSLEGHLRALHAARAIEREMGVPLAVLGDLSGPKIRLGEIGGAGEIPLQPGDELVVQRLPVSGGPGRVSTNYDRFVDEVRPGHRVLIDDGNVALIVERTTAHEAVCRCTRGGIISGRKGVNLPDTPLTVPAMTDHDRACAAWGVEHGLDYLALSFVRTAGDVRELRALLDAAGSDLPIIAKIEKPQGVADIGPILDAADGVMVARGDLGVEIDVAQVPIVQKELIRCCREAGKPVIVATQMLQTMVASPVPTRAEVSDIANAIHDGSDAVMLSGETAVGQFPVHAVETMNHIADVTERYLFSQPAPPQPVAPRGAANERESALARGAYRMAESMRVKLIVAWSQSGLLARYLSKLRPSVPVVALTSDPRIVRRMTLYFGVLPIEMPAPDTLDDLVPQIDALLTARSLASPGDPILILASTTPGEPGKANAVMAHEVQSRN